MAEEIKNRVESSNLIQISLDDYYPTEERVVFDLKPLLKDEMVLVEKDLRAFVTENDWSFFQNKYVSIICSVDAIVPLWAFMLIASKIEPFAKKVVFGDLTDLEKSIFNDVFFELDFKQFQNKYVIVKGCGKHPIPEAVFVDFSIKLQKFAKSIMFGEACSSVPLFKRKN